MSERQASRPAPRSAALCPDARPCSAPLRSPFWSTWRSRSDQAFSPVYVSDRTQALFPRSRSVVTARIGCDCRWRSLSFPAALCSPLRFPVAHRTGPRWTAHSGRELPPCPPPRDPDLAIQSASLASDSGSSFISPPVPSRRPVSLGRHKEDGDLPGSGSHRLRLSLDPQTREVLAGEHD
jgi:hypothetical protein